MLADAQQRSAGSIAGGKRKSESETQQRVEEAEGRPKRREQSEQRGTKRALGTGRGGVEAAGPQTRRARGAFGGGEGGTSRGGSFMTRS